MFLNEPLPTRADLHFRIFGFPVRVHPLFWLVAALLGGGGDLRAIAPWIGAMFVGILIHEMGHALVMRLYGFAPRITLYMFGGLASCGHFQPVGARRLRPWDQILISAAGPGAGFLLAAAICGGLILAGYTIDPLGRSLPWSLVPRVRELERVWQDWFTDGIDDLLQISVLWGIFNLVPMYPLDGGQIARQLLTLNNPRDGLRQSLILSFLAGVGLVGLAITHGMWLTGLFLAGLTYETFVALQGGRGPRW